MKKEMLNAEVATEKKTPCSFRFHSVYSIWLIVRGILGILGFVFGIAVLFNFSKLENKAALTIIVPTMFGLFCAIAAFITSGKLRKRSGYIANITMLLMDTVFAGMLGGCLGAKWLGLYPMDQLRVMHADYLTNGYGVAEWASAPAFNWLIAVIAAVAFLVVIAAPVFIYYYKRRDRMLRFAPKVDPAAHSSKLLRRPMQYAFPIFVLPTLAAFFIGFIWPFLLGLYRSFSRFSSPIDFTWNGFANYVKAFNDEGFRHAFGFTALYAIVSIVLINVFSFALAYALTQKLKGSNIFRTVFFMPNLIGGIVLAYIWKLIFDAILGSSYMTNANVGFWALVVLVAWQQIGYIMIIYIAGLQAVPEDMLEAAKIDGANRWQTLWRVTIPNVMPSITICMFLTLTNSFKLFDQNFALTGGSPKLPGTRILQTEMLALHIFNTNNINNKWIGTAQAEAVIFFILVAALALIQLRATKTKEVQQ